MKVINLLLETMASFVIGITVITLGGVIWWFYIQTPVPFITPIAIALGYTIRKIYRLTTEQEKEPYSQ